MPDMILLPLSKRPGIQGGEVIKLISHREVWMMYIFIFAYVAAEIAVATWFVADQKNESDQSRKLR